MWYTEWRMNKWIYMQSSGVSRKKYQYFKICLKLLRWAYKVKSLSHVWPFVTLWTVACQAPPSMGFSRQEYWSGLPFPSPGDLPNPGIKPRSPALQADSLPSEPPGKPRWAYGLTKTQTVNHKGIIECFPSRLQEEYWVNLWCAHYTKK